MVRSKHVTGVTNAQDNSEGNQNHDELTLKASVASIRITAIFSVKDIFSSYV